MISVQATMVEDDILGAEEVAAAYANVTVGVLAASVVGLAMASILVPYADVGALRGTLFVLYLGLLSGVHIWLRARYVRDPDRARRWRRWARPFVAVALLEGLGWGWTSFGLIPYDDLRLSTFCVLGSGGVAVASIAVFGCCRSAFLAFYIPTVVPFVVCDALSHDPLQRQATALILVYFLAMLFFGLAFNRFFRRIVGLRHHAEKLAAELKIQIQSTEAASRAKSMFLAAASHDLRQPVHAVSLFIGALRTMKMPEPAMHVIEQIEASSQAMDQLFAALLDISRLDAGVVEVRKRPFAIDAVIGRICREQSAEAAAKRLAFRHRPCHANVSGDPILIERVLRNLVTNAVRYTVSGGVLIACRRRGGRLLVQVWDTGPGIPVDEQERIFQEYYQLGNPERDRTRGLGLGLAIVRRLTTLMNVPLSLRSDVGRGSRFEIELDLAAAPAGAPSSRPRAVVADPLAGRLIVVVDDEAPIRAAMRSLLAGWGHDVVAAGSGSEVIASLATSSRRPDLIICDLRLRGHETGTTVVEAIRTEYNASIPAILVTGDTSPDRLADARASGLLVLHKPVSNGRLRAALTNVIAHGVIPQGREMAPAQAALNDL